MLASIDVEALGRVTAGTNAGPADLGRCGPGSDWKFLGDVRTPECMAHDVAVRSALQNGEPRFMAHLKALPLLPSAIGSYFRALVTGH